MPTTLTFGAAPGGADGFGHDLPLEPELADPIVVDLSAVRNCHPMFVVRLRLFIDWHLDLDHEVHVIGPTSDEAARHLADMRLAADLPPGLVSGIAGPADASPVLGVTRLAGDQDVEAVAQEAVEVLHHQTGVIAGWGDALHMAISELCDNAVHHGANQDWLPRLVEGPGSPIRWSQHDRGEVIRCPDYRSLTVLPPPKESESCTTS